mmetsp:Transcript_25204/g.53091  ORF Transcript_25204/g.53091 Transcript_25204/m.53091 type:complete len:95 (+) Transcript_25204:1467-1751(+)
MMCEVRISNWFRPASRGTNNPGRESTRRDGVPGTMSEFQMHPFQQAEVRMIGPVKRVDWKRLTRKDLVFVEWRRQQQQHKHRNEYNMNATRQVK